MILNLDITKKINTTIILNIIFIIYALFFIVDSALERICIYLATIIWILEGSFKKKFNQLLQQKIILLYFGIIILFIISLTFLSNSISNGFWDNKYLNGYQYIFSKNITYFLMAIYISTSMKKEFITPVFIAYIIQSLYISLYSYFIYFGLLKGNSEDPVHFVHHIFFSIILTLAFFTSIYLYKKVKKKYLQIILFFVSLMFLINLFIIGGRLGQVALLFTILILFYYYMIIYKKEPFIKIFIPIIGIIIFIIIAYDVSNNFKERVNKGVSDIKKVEVYSDFSTSWGTRIGFDIVNTKLLLSSPKKFLFGYGMGNSKRTIKNFIEKNDQNKLTLLQHNHVHNQFFQIWIDGGFLALILYIWIYIELLRLNTKINDKLLIISFASVFLVYSMGDIIYHRGKILGLFVLFIGLFLAINKYLEREKDR